MTIEKTFADFNLHADITSVLDQMGFINPTPIQQEAIPLLLEGKDILGQAQTGSGKTAAFALPLLSRLDTSKKHLQILILAPTRELAIQVAEACEQFSANLTGVRVATIYGGSDYRSQFNQLKAGAQIVVATPGRLIDHMKRGSIDVSNLSAFVLDEADEMLRMGFIDDVEWVLEQLPADHQLALFSATMPNPILRIARKYLKNAQEIVVKPNENKLNNIEQHYWVIQGMKKRVALARILESEDTNGVLIFVKTKRDSDELADEINRIGLKAVALNGDIPQDTRTKTIEKIKQGKIDILVATDVAARGLDIDRISHVINYDSPHNIETYIHRIGRTGRAGRSGKAILFISPREMGLKRKIEHKTKANLSRMEIPSIKQIKTIRLQKFKAQIAEVVKEQKFDDYLTFVNELQAEFLIDMQHIAAAIAKISQGDRFKKMAEEQKEQTTITEFAKKNRKQDRGDRSPKRREGSRQQFSDQDSDSYRIEIGHNDGVKPKNIVGAIANEAGIEGKLIRAIQINEKHSTLLLPKGMPKEIYHTLQKAWVCGKQLNISRI